MPADFGPRLPPAGLAGLLVVANPLDGCAPQGGGGLVPPPPDAVPAGATWIALIERSPPPEPSSSNENGDDDEQERREQRDRALLQSLGGNDGGDFEALSGLLGAFLGGGESGIRRRGGFVLATDVNKEVEKSDGSSRRDPSPSPSASPSPPPSPKTPPCSFDAKVRAAAAAGASAAIIFDNAPGEPLVIMAKAGGAPEPTIPAVFISAEGEFESFEV